jgi:hypothetical protein
VIYLVDPPLPGGVSVFQRRNGILSQPRSLGGSPHLVLSDYSLSQTVQDLKRKISEIFRDYTKSSIRMSQPLARCAVLTFIFPLVYYCRNFSSDLMVDLTLLKAIVCTFHAVKGLFWLCRC